jgi:hypothetical protein
VRRLRLLTSRPYILPAIILPCPNVDQAGEQKFLVASNEKKHATLERRSQYDPGWVNSLRRRGLCLIDSQPPV